MRPDGGGSVRRGLGLEAGAGAGRRGGPPSQAEPSGPGMLCHCIILLNVIYVKLPLILFLFRSMGIRLYHNTSFYVN